jgi:hypothetical protein
MRWSKEYTTHVKLQVVKGDATAFVLLLEVKILKIFTAKGSGFGVAQGSY